MASLFLLLIALTEAKARAAEPPRVLVVASVPRAPVIERALPLIRGELTGAGLSAEVREDQPQTADAQAGTYGTLRLETSASTIIIRAFAPGDPTPITTRVDADEAGVDAEVIAVRAVETLRAAVLQFAEAHREGLPEAVRGFAQLPKPAEPAAADARSTHPSTMPVERVLTMQAFVGPELVWQPRLSASPAAEGGLRFGPRWGFVAAAFESTLYRSRVRGSAGRADIMRRVVSLGLGARFHFAQAWELDTQASAGYAGYTVNGKGMPGFVGRDLEHGALLTSLTLGGAYYFGRVLGVYLSCTGAVAFDAPVVQIVTQDQSALDRPSLSISSGALLDLF